MIRRLASGLALAVLIVVSITGCHVGFSVHSPSGGVIRVTPTSSARSATPSTSAASG